MAIRHPQEMGAEEVKAFLSHLATQMNVAACTQKTLQDAKSRFAAGSISAQSL
jgi:hypothetical protein